MYGKIFASMYDGTLVEHWEALVTFQQMIILCDSDGNVDVTLQALANRTGIPLKILTKGIEILEQPDPHSRTPDNDGCRIERIDEHRPWGWVIVNYCKYKGLQDQDTVRAQTRERVRRHREKKRTVTAGNAQKRHIDIEVDKDQDRSNEIKKSPFETWWSAYPKKVKKKTARDIWKRKRLDSQAEALIADVETRLKTDRRWLEGFVPDPTTYLSQERWQDEIESAAAAKTDNMRFVS